MLSLVNVPGLVLGLLISAPALYDAYNSPTVDIVGVLFRFVVATVIMSLGYGFVRELVAGYEDSARRRDAQSAQENVEEEGRRVEQAIE